MTNYFRYINEHGVHEKIATNGIHIMHSTTKTTHHTHGCTIITSHTLPHRHHINQTYHIVKTHCHTPQLPHRYHILHIVTQKTHGTHCHSYDIKHIVSHIPHNTQFHTDAISPQIPHHTHRETQIPHNKNLHIDTMSSTISIEHG